MPSTADASVIVLKQGQYLYRRSWTPVTKNKLAEHRYQWFALTPGYGSDDTYGPIVSTWTNVKPLVLLNISNSHTRRALAYKLGIEQYVLSCDYQYSGGRTNKESHEHISQYLRKAKLHGTYISEDIADDDCEGATEVVLPSKTMQFLRKC